ncbi:MAG: hypothetical protein GY771_08055 [bacterium]|nr:hypothetical protein [bacterium]
MLGDKLIIKEHHTRAARDIARIIEPSVAISKDRYTISIGGESGSGKSETAAELSRFLGKAGYSTVVLAQDDYFVCPPESNHRKRLENLDWVGTGEVRLDLLDKHIELIKDIGVKELRKPLSVFKEDRLDEETLDLFGCKVVIAEGTYTNMLGNVDRRIFRGKSYQNTLKSRQERARDTIDEFSDKILEIEHSIISQHKQLADIVINRDFTVTAVSDRLK